MKLSLSTDPCRFKPSNLSRMNETTGGAVVSRASETDRHIVSTRRAVFRRADAVASSKSTSAKKKKKRRTRARARPRATGLRDSSSGAERIRSDDASYKSTGVKKEKALATVTDSTDISSEAERVRNDASSKSTGVKKKKALATVTDSTDISSEAERVRSGYFGDDASSKSAGVKKEKTLATVTDSTDISSKVERVRSGYLGG